VLGCRILRRKNSYQINPNVTGDGFLRLNGAMIPPQQQHQGLKSQMFSRSGEFKLHPCGSLSRSESQAMHQRFTAAWLRFSLFAFRAFVQKSKKLGLSHVL
jgi:hypothetical protein